MPFVADPEQLSLMAEVLDRYCALGGLSRHTETYQALARRVVELFDAGVRDSEEMARALSQATSPDRQRRRVDKDKIERATREAKALIDAECQARKDKSARLRELRLGAAMPLLSDGSATVEFRSDA